MRQPFDQMVAGVNADAAPWILPPNVWTDTRNVRFRDGAGETFQGQAQVFGTTIGDALRLLPISNGTDYYWVYAGDQNIYATDGSSHGNITPAIISSVGSNVPGWTGGAFQGFMVLTNGTADNPFTWAPGLLTQCIPLVNWPATLSTQVMRPYRNFLFALRCTESGVYNSRLLRWGSSANPASLPTSWDYTDPTNDSGRVEFGQTNDQLIDLIPMRDIGVLYKENYTWSIQYRGGIDNPFIFRQVFSQIGMLSEWCATPVRGSHVVLSSNDLIIHDLNQANSLIDKQFRNWLFNQIDGDNYRQCFVVPNYKNREVWVCFPEAGHSYANLALVWSYQENTLQVRELGADMRHINWGIVNSGSSGPTFDGITGTFDAQTGSFDEQQFNPIFTSLLLSDGTKLLQGDQGGTFDGAMIESYWERKALPLDKDIQRFVHVHRVHPKVIGGVGETLNVSIGTRKTPESVVAWSTPQPFVIGTDTFTNFRSMGRVIDIRFEYSGTQTIKLFGFDVEWSPAGYF